MAVDRDAERVYEMVRLSGRPPYETALWAALDAG
jgi:hypothetical protein